MTIFTRTDKTADKTPEKTPEAVSAAKAPARATGDLPMTDTFDSKRNQPAPQPSSAAQPTMASVISKALKITGQLESTEDIHIEGQVEGDVRAVNVKIGNNAKVKGTVYGDEVEVSGTIDGKIEAKKVVLTRTAHMSGDVVHQDIKIESGAYIDGHCRPELGKAAASAYKTVSLVRDQAKPADTALKA